MRTLTILSIMCDLYNNFASLQLERGEWGIAAAGLLEPESRLVCGGGGEVKMSLFLLFFWGLREDWVCLDLWLCNSVLLDEPFTLYLQVLDFDLPDFLLQFLYFLLGSWTKLSRHFILIAFLHFLCLSHLFPLLFKLPWSLLETVIIRLSYARNPLTFPHTWSRLVCSPFPSFGSRHLIAHSSLLLFLDLHLHELILLLSIILHLGCLTSADQITLMLESRKRFFNLTIRTCDNFNMLTVGPSVPFDRPIIVIVIEYASPDS